MDKTDLQELKAFRKQNPKATIQDLEEVVEAKVEMKELENTLIEIGNQLSYKFSQVVKDNIGDISKIEDKEKKLQFIIKESFSIYSKEQEDRDKEMKGIESNQAKENI